MSITEQKKWYAIYTNPRAEKKVTQLLSNKGFDAYLPLQTTLKQWSDRKKKVEEPLFKSYVFVHIFFEKEHIDVLNTSGVVKFIKIGKELSAIRPEIIKAIQLSLQHFDDLETSSENFQLHQKVEVIAGPLQGYKGVIAEQHGNRYFAIQIEQLGTHLLLKVPSQHLSPTSI
ncbi:MAG: UpxY family transcription antiterminator [Bacteroidota bacterium]